MRILGILGHRRKWIIEMQNQTNFLKEYNLNEVRVNRIKPLTNEVRTNRTNTKTSEDRANRTNTVTNEANKTNTKTKALRIKKEKGCQELK